jgi:hypothetical protein
MHGSEGKQVMQASNTLEVLCNCMHGSGTAIFFSFSTTSGQSSDADVRVEM